MRAVVQRVTGGSVDTAQGRIAAIERGLVVLLGVAKGDSHATVAALAKNIATLRIFDDADGRMNLSALDVSAQILLVSQFTLCADISRGRRPGFDPAARPDEARALCEAFAQALRDLGLDVREGEFGAHMRVSILNDGPVTFVVDAWPITENGVEL